MITDWLGKPWHSLDFHLKETFGGKVYKLALDGGMTCPNRDGTLGTGGCIFCSAGGSGDFAAAPCGSVKDQVERAKARIAKKLPKEGAGYIAYFQSYTNTYAPLPYLERLFTETVRLPEIRALSVGTRPDCLPDETVALLARLNMEKPVWVELGLQTIHQTSARLIRRGYDLPVFEDAVKKLQDAGLTVVAHVILGLPGETRDMMLDTVKYLGSAGIGGIKLQLLHVLRGTELCALYEAGAFKTMEFEEYIALVGECLKILPQDIVIHRLSGDGPKKLLEAPLWSGDKRRLLNAMTAYLRENGIYQGMNLQA